MKFDLYSILLLYLIKYKGINFIELDKANEYKLVVDKYFNSLNFDYEILNKYSEIFESDGKVYLRLKNDINKLDILMYFDDLPIVFVMCTQVAEALEVVGLTKENYKIVSLDKVRKI